jgi:hypothetical protein
MALRPEILDDIGLDTQPWERRSPRIGAAAKTL